ncbi:AAA domain, putative AbiEii toxin, type IV TA system [Kordia sp. SMS9]|uniref:AAA family ATPase n=1 Tax=Kordia sp. SMS9 TaxID=2282170 RepID=UPI000E0D7C4A|nr:ATP-binding protein [Kordia sp. SMS9]AXG68602.1 AAA domain, putative AbiEii toxin, type IV TA system [Kordia sp. SMS9]
MLVKFTVENYLSFKNRMTIDFTATSLTELRDANLHQTSLKNVTLLKSMIIYGANSNGKSNLFKAIKFARKFILNSSKDSQSDEPIEVQPFCLSTETIEKPSFFELVFVYEAAKYRYGFEVDDTEVHKEWLYMTTKNKEQLLFERDFQNITVTKKYDAASSNLTSITRKNALFLSVCAQFNIPTGMAILKALSNVQYISGMQDRYTVNFTIDMMDDPEKKKYIDNFIASADLGFTETKVERFKLTEEILEKGNVPKEIRKMILESDEENVVVSTKHIIYDENNEEVDNIYFNLFVSESLGTGKYVALAGPIIDALMHGKTLIIDEFDAQLHPHLSKAIVELFNSKENNPNGAQLIFASHNPSLINPKRKLFRRDQIIITEKDQFGVTTMESLYDKKIRKDASFEKDYLEGKYDGIPDVQIDKDFRLFDA